MSGRFRYVAVDREGRRRTGMIEAASSQAAVNTLAGRGETAVSVSQNRSRGRARSHSSGLRLDKAQLAGLLENLAALLDAGVPLRRALSLIEEEAAASAIGRAARLVGERLSDGAGVGSALALERDGDLRLVAELARAGEMGGGLVNTFRIGADLFRRQADVRREVSKALAYPAFLLILSLIAFGVLVGFVAPSLAELSADAGQNDSLIKTLAAAGTLMTTWWPALVGVAIAGVFAARAVLGGQRGRLFVDALVLRLPIIGAISRDISYGGSSRCLAALLAGGVGAADAFDLAALAGPNRMARRNFARAAEAIRDGAAVSTAVGAIPGAPGELVQLARIGQEAGALAAMIDRAGDIAFKRAFRRLGTATELLGPALIGAIGVLIGLVFWSFMSAVLSLGDVAL